MRTASPTPIDHDITAAAGAGRGVHRLAVVLLLAAASSLQLLPATAQNNACTTIENDAERLACYDRALRPAPPAAAAPAAAAAPTAVAAPAAVATPTTSAAPAAAPAPAAAATTEPAIVPIVVVSVRAPPGRGATFTTETGETWVQSDSRQNALPDVPFDAEIKPGAMNSRFLVPKGTGRAIRVRRAE